MRELNFILFQASSTLTINQINCSLNFTVENHGELGVGREFTHLELNLIEANELKSLLEVETGERVVGEEAVDCGAAVQQAVAEQLVGKVILEAQAVAEPERVVAQADELADVAEPEARLAQQLFLLLLFGPWVLEATLLLFAARRRRRS